jgi:hypothetical protein
VRCSLFSVVRCEYELVCLDCVRYHGDVTTVAVERARRRQVPGRQDRGSMLALLFCRFGLSNDKLAFMRARACLGRGEANERGDGGRRQARSHHQDRARDDQSSFVRNCAYSICGRRTFRLFVLKSVAVRAEVDHARRRTKGQGHHDREAAKDRRLHQANRNYDRINGSSVRVFYI